MRDLYNKHYKTLLGKKIEDDINKWKLNPCFWIGRLNIVQMYQYYPKWVPQQSLSKPNDSFCRNKKSILKIYNESQNNSQNNLEKRLLNFGNIFVSADDEER